MTASVCLDMFFRTHNLTWTTTLNAHRKLHKDSRQSPSGRHGNSFPARMCCKMRCSVCVGAGAVWASLWNDRNWEVDWIQVCWVWLFWRFLLWAESNTQVCNKWPQVSLEWELFMQAKCNAMLCVVFPPRWEAFQPFREGSLNKMFSDPLNTTGLVNVKVCVH